jgi:type IV secretion system protein VirB9
MQGLFKAVGLVLLVAGSSSGAVAQLSGISTPPITDTTTYPFQKAVDILTGKQLAGTPVPSVRSLQAATKVALGEPLEPSVGDEIPLKRPAMLNLWEKRALEIGDAEKSANSMPEPDKQGRVTYTYGEGLPTVITSPMHISTIELEPGETVTGEPAIGDSIRWEMIPGSSGSGADTQPLVMLKPHMGGLETDLVITTSKRIYYLRLVSQEKDYIARVAFSYKDDEDARWKEYLAKQQEQKVITEDAQVVTPMVGDAIDHLNFEYTIKGKDSVITPLRVMDDGVKTYITMPNAALHQDLPALIVVNPRLKGEKAQELVNYRVKGNLYIVDRLFDRAALLLGNGKTAEKVEIRRTVPLSGGVR